MKLTLLVENLSGNKTEKHIDITRDVPDAEFLREMVVDMVEIIKNTNYPI